MSETMPKRRMRQPSGSKMVAVALPSCFCLLVIALAFPDAATAWLPETTRFSTTGRHNQLVRGPLQVGMTKKSDEVSPHHEESAASRSLGHHPSENTSDEDEAKGEDKAVSCASSASSASQQRNVTQEVLKKVRVAKAQAEIDRILQGPDAPIDTEAELEKVVSMSHIPSEQPLLEAEMAQLESELYQAVKQQDFTRASLKQAELGQKNLQQVDDGGAILQVNAAFYRAFSKKSLQKMEEVWLQHDGGDTSICIHPSHKPLVGARRISKSWKQMFASTDGSFQRNWMEPHDIRLLQKGSHMAIVTCEEHVFCRRFVRGQKRRTELINKLLATNIFRKVNQQWYMCYHHASWHPDSEAAKRALMGGSGDDSTVVSSDEDYEPTSSLAASLAARRRRRRRQLEDEENEEEVSIGMDGILGTDFGPVLGDEKSDDNDDNNGEGIQHKRIIMGGSLSDILNGGLGDLLSGKDSAGTSNINNNINNNSNGLPQQGIIISRVHHHDDDDEEDDDIDLHHLEEDDEDEDDDDVADHEGESVAIIKEWAKSSSQAAAAKRQNEDTKEGGVHSTQEGTVTASSDAAKKGGKVFKDSLRQNCISALRKLCDQGTLAPKQKRVLLTDIITCSSKGEFSMVEVAYELLCGEGEADEEDAAEEEFAEQCRVFAQELLVKDQAETF